MKLIVIVAFILLVPMSIMASSSPLVSPQQPNMIDVGKPCLTQSQETKWTQLTGKWFGNELARTGGKQMWVADRRNDGTYQIQFRLVDITGKTRDKIETGEWGVSGDIYFTIYKADIINGKVVPVDPTDPYNRDAYKILKLTDDTFEYISMDSGNKFTVRKVRSDFKFPE